MLKLLLPRCSTPPCIIHLGSCKSEGGVGSMTSSKIQSICHKRLCVRVYSIYHRRADGMVGNSCSNRRAVSSTARDRVTASEIETTLKSLHLHNPDVLLCLSGPGGGGGRGACADGGPAKQTERLFLPHAPPLITLAGNRSAQPVAPSSNASHKTQPLSCKCAA